jgi:3-methyladenine DNA glycosylase AlkD
VNEPLAKAQSYAGAARALRQLADPKRAEFFRQLFEDPRGNVFLGVASAEIRRTARTFRDLEPLDVRRLMASDVRDERALANAVLVAKYERADEAERLALFAFYVRQRRLIRNWDGVDDSAPYLAGRHLLERSRSPLFRWARSERMLDRRIAIVSTWWFIRHGDTADTFRLATVLRTDPERLMQRAVGWMLREAGKRNPGALKRFLARHQGQMPRLMLRSAIERLPEGERRSYLR